MSRKWNYSCIIFILYNEKKKKKNYIGVSIPTDIKKNNILLIRRFHRKFYSHHLYLNASKTKRHLNISFDGYIKKVAVMNHHHHHIYIVITKFKD